MPVERSTTQATPGVTGTGDYILDTGATITTPTIVRPVMVDADGVSQRLAHVKFCTTQFDAVTGTTGVTLTNIVGLTGFTLAAAGTYTFEINLGTVGTTNSGVKIGLGYTTLTATSIEYQVVGFTATAVAGSRGTTSTTGMTLFGATTATLVIRITGRLVVNAGGTVAVQAAQNAAHADTTSVFVGSWARFQRIG